jgi:hypothetical protein
MEQPQEFGIVTLNLDADPEGRDGELHRTVCLEKPVWAHPKHQGLIIGPQCSRAISPRWV